MTIANYIIRAIASKLVAKWGKTDYQEGVAMPKKPLEAIEEHFSKVIDPYKKWTKDHKLIDTIGIAICAVR